MSAMDLDAVLVNMRRVSCFRGPFLLLCGRQNFPTKGEDPNVPEPNGRLLEL